MSKNQKINNVRFYTGFWLGIGIIVFTIADFSIFLVLLLYPPARLQFDDFPTWLVFMTILGTVVFPLLGAIITIYRCFRLIVIDEKGIHVSLFKVFFKKELPWKEIKEILFAIRPFPCVFVSKREELYMFNYDKLVDRKGVVQIMMNKKVYNAITKYYDRPITNLTEEVIGMLDWDKERKGRKKHREKRK